jgi:oligopeptide/dipeptide ABC transporter ATP-binding protein
VTSELTAEPPGLRADLQDPYLRVEELTKIFRTGRGGRDRGQEIRAVDRISFDIAGGEALALVGETGSGKSTTARCVLRLLEPTGGRVLLDGCDLATLGSGELRMLRRDMQIVFQDPYSSLDPRMTIGAIVEEPLRIHGERDHVKRRQEVERILELVGISPELVRRKPYAFSGGQRQRIAIARALVMNPRLVVLDEPVTALDVSIQAQVLNLLTDLQRRLGLTYLFIVHDLAVAEHIAQRVAVMYLGALVEIGDRDAVFGAPLHPYTVALLSAVPVPDARSSQRRERILLTGEVGLAGGAQRGCRFQPRCPVGRDREVCQNQEPPLADVASGHWAACHFPGELSLRLTSAGAALPASASQAGIHDDSPGSGASATVPEVRETGPGFAERRDPKEQLR